ncbi:triose-phosphate isomerase [Tateyamaria omphalii]|uniref:Triosephosphate isomerase n=1 Tax=Tateyamaria omphalii TaxID=299262 RepID=A0A1P8MT48_9RHOB|nr:triose-phosphate isomerase [Tateyamaria omphalii]APX11221.1 triose-phosphate isomerase [Tateyamaria omphalii]
MRRKLAAGNWKMNGTPEMLAELSTLTGGEDGPQILICPPAPLLTRAADVTLGSKVEIGGQDCHANTSGAHTGDIAASMLKDAGATAVIVGHSERRADHAETDAHVRAKAEAAYAAGLTAIICIGESEEERLGPDCLDIIAAQLDGSTPDTATADNTVIAYEPIWAIGTGRVPTMAQIVETHDMIRANLTARFGDAGAHMRVLYGGSVKPTNAAEIFQAENVDGALVGGASLKASDFQPIIDALAAS